MLCVNIKSRGAISAAVAQQLYTLLVGGSNPSSPTMVFAGENLAVVIDAARRSGYGKA